jgi:chloramphenicol 3-O-phosphotransferase
VIRPPAVEPVAAPWRPRSVADILTELREAHPVPPGRPFLLAVDGRQGSGKSTVAGRLAELDAGAVIVHTDDVAWWESFFGWDRLMAEGVLAPLRVGRSVEYRPPAWETRGREGSIVVPVEAPLVLVEGVGSSRRSLAALLDAAVWVQSDFAAANRRGIARDGDTREAADFWWEWDREEQPFLAADRPWERADAVICGSPDLVPVGFDAATEVLVGRPLNPSAARERQQRGT